MYASDVALLSIGVYGEKKHIFMGNKNPLKLTLNERQLWVHTKIIVHLSVSFSAPTKQCLNISIKGVALIKALDF